MPYARLTKKERLAVFLSESDSNKTEPHTEVIAAIRLRPIGRDTLITGMLVHPSFRGQGLGHSLMNAIINELNDEHAFLFALPHLVSFYQQHGFNPLQTPPNDIAQLFIKHQRKHKPLCLMGFKKM
ncbi:GNAT family N-acetyltransferase [Shewanella sp. VB17]|nr:GNAT family N-acetyltransferase [Shewanella sp. VB17]